MRARHNIYIHNQLLVAVSHLLSLYSYSIGPPIPFCFGFGWLSSGLIVSHPPVLFGWSQPFFAWFSTKRVTISKREIWNFFRRNFRFSLLFLPNLYIIRHETQGGMPRVCWVQSAANLPWPHASFEVSYWPMCCIQRCSLVGWTVSWVCFKKYQWMHLCVSVFQGWLSS